VASALAACVITGYGVNADEELAEAFRLAGARADRVHVNDLLARPSAMDRYGILAFPGGFSFGDHLGSGLVFAGLCRGRMKDALERFIERGKLVIGICNGFQTLVKLGILPNLGGTWEQEASLVHNSSGVFENRWVKVRFGEGRFVASEEILSRLEQSGQVAARYAPRWDGTGAVSYPDNPNGSELDIAGICDSTGRVFGLMPHPEAFIFPHNHPRWTREEVSEGQGLRIFRNAVRHLAD